MAKKKLVKIKLHKKKAKKLSKKKSKSTDTTPEKNPIVVNRRMHPVDRRNFDAKINKITSILKPVVEPRYLASTVTEIKLVLEFVNDER